MGILMKHYDLRLLLVALAGLTVLATPAAALVCGDSEPDAGEECDDGNTTPGDGCSATCTVEAGSDCTAAIPSMPGTPPVPPVPSVCLVGECGDSIQSMGESCDDGNMSDGDGCSSACAVESGFACTAATSALDVLMGSTAFPSSCTLVPDPPLFVAGRPKPGKIDLLWSPVDGADEYIVLRGQGPAGVAKSPIGTSTKTLFVDFDVSPGTVYTYSVQTVVGGIVSDPSEEFEVFIPAIR